jgi:hypothetical protein
MKITPSNYADPAIWVFGGILRLFGLCAFGPSQMTVSPVSFSATRAGTFPAIPLPEFRFFNRAGMPAILEENAKTNRGLRQGS